MRIKDFFDRLGLNGVKWQWRVLRWENRWDQFQARLRDGRRHVQYRHKVCPACGALVDREDRHCLRCGARVGSWPAQAALRAVGLVLPALCPVTGLLVAANVVNFLVMLVAFGPRGLLTPSGAALWSMGALVPPACWGGEYWRLITYGYLHIGLIHIAFNMFALSQLGPALEQQFRSARFFSAYTLALIGGGLADLLIRPGAVITIAGASGAIFGLIGLGMSFAHFYGGPLGREQRNFFLKWALYNFVFGYFVGADNIAHFGGFVTGAALGWLFERQRRGGDRGLRGWTFVAGALAVLTVAAYIWLVLDKIL